MKKRRIFDPKSFCDKPIVELHKEYLQKIDGYKKGAAKAEKLEARVKELEQKIKLWHDALENGIFAIARSQVVHSMQKVIRGNDE